MLWHQVLALFLRTTRQPDTPHPPPPAAHRVLLSAQLIAAQMRALGDAAADDDSHVLGVAAAAALLAVRQQSDAVSGTIQSLREGQLSEALAVTPLQQESPCIICQDVMTEGEGACELPCRHSFHPRCLSRWLSFRPVCPLCMLAVDL